MQKDCSQVEVRKFSSIVLECVKRLDHCDTAICEIRTCAGSFWDGHADKSHTPNRSCMRTDGCGQLLVSHDHKSRGAGRNMHDMTCPQSFQRFKTAIVLAPTDARSKLVGRPT